MSKKFRINQFIRVPTVRLIDENDGQAGIVGIEKALEMARAAEMDLVEVAPQAKPPVCKIMDFGKFLYRQKKQEQKQKKTSKQGEVKSIRLSMRIDQHDMEIKAKRSKEFLAERNLVKATMMLRGREITRMDIATEKMKQFAEMLKDASEFDPIPKRQGKNLSMLFTPK